MKQKRYLYLNDIESSVILQIVLNSGESGATTIEVAVMAMEEQAPVDFDNKSKNTEFHRFEYD